jgi:hypothetical protein
MLYQHTELFYVIIQIASGNARGLATSVATAAASAANVVGSDKGRSRRGGAMLQSAPPGTEKDDMMA